MAPTRTRTVKNKHAANKSGIKGSRSSKNPDIDPVSKSKKPKGKNAIQTPLKGRPSISDLLKKRKKKVYSEKELDIPKLNMITPVGVEKPKGKKKGKVFVDDRVRSLHPPMRHRFFGANFWPLTGEHVYDSCDGPG